MIADRINAWAKSEAAKRPPTARIGAHNAGQCVRKLWYVHHGATGEPVDARAILLFDLGDHVEDAVLDFLAGAGVALIRTNEKRDMAEVRIPNLHSDAPGYAIRCRPDAYAEIDGERLIVEVKSVSDFAFQRIERGELNEEHLAQVEIYLRAFGVKRGVILYYRKETSHLAEVIVTQDPARWQAIQDRIRAAIADTAPARPYEISTACDGIADGTCIAGKTPAKGQAHKACGGTGLNPLGAILPKYPCGYCPYKAECWGQLEMVVDRGAPRWRLRA